MIHHDPEEDRKEKNEEFSLRQEQHHWAVAAEERLHQHEITLKEMDNSKDIRIKELELQIAKAQTILREKAISRRAYWLGIIKLPVMPFALLVVLVLELMHRDTPQGLDEFLSL